MVLVDASTFADLHPPYGTVVADPPWAYRNTDGLPTRARRNPAAAQHYSTMTVEDIKALPVADLAAKNAHLYLWVTNPLLFSGVHDVVEAWGFRYVTTLTWVKQGSPGMGSYFRGDTEHVLFGVRGKAPIPPDRRVSNVFTAHKRGHSVKPPCLGDVIEQVSPGPYVELFCRQPRFGWDSWGHGYETGAA